jgi:hypothetical protein
MIIFSTWPEQSKTRVSYLSETDLIDLRSFITILNIWRRPSTWSIPKYIRDNWRGLIAEQRKHLLILLRLSPATLPKTSPYASVNSEKIAYVFGPAPTTYANTTKTATEQVKADPYQVPSLLKLILYLFFANSAYQTYLAFCIVDNLIEDRYRPHGTRILCLTGMKAEGHNSSVFPFLSQLFDQE